MELNKTLFTKGLGSLDSSPGQLFKNMFYYIFKVLAIGVFIYGLFLLISGMFGKTGYFSMLRTLDTFELIRSIICFVITFFISALIFFSIGLILWKRANSFKSFEYNGTILLFPRLIKSFGEIIAILPISAALISFFAIILSAIPYAPIEPLSQLMGGTGSSIMNHFVGNTFSAIFIDNINDYFKLLFQGGFLGLITGFLLSIGALFGSYTIAELFELLIYFLIRKPINK